MRLPRPRTLRELLALGSPRPSAPLLFTRWLASGGGPPAGPRWRLVAAALAFAACDGEPCPSARVAWSGGALEVCAPVASSAAERTAGLVGREPLGTGDGLVLAFPTVGEVCIVNEGVPYSIDAIHVGDDGRVVSVTCGLQANDEAPRCHPDTRWVLEVRSPEGCAVPLGAEASYDR